MDPHRLTVHEPGYPALLGAVPSPPPELWVLGELLPEDALAVAVVGARRASSYGLEVARRLATDLAARGVTVVSGLARGVDSAAHRGALAAGGRTIAVLGSGLDVIYPPEHRRLAHEIERQGAVVSQFTPGTPPLPGHFPVRNRAIAGLALGVVVAEAGERSGALITATLAAELGREVFAVPGPVTSETSRGTNRLIQEGAKLVQDWTDIVQELPDPWRRAIRAPANAPGEAFRPAADSDEGRLLAMLTADEPRHIEALIARAELPAGRVAAALCALELAGWARQLEGQRWLGTGARRT